MTICLKLKMEDTMALLALVYGIRWRKKYYIQDTFFVDRWCSYGGFFKIIILFD